jgi:hypothetical protein
MFNFLHVFCQSNSKVFGLKMDEFGGGLRKFHNEELHNLYALPNVIRMNNSRRMRWVGQGARMGRRGMHPHISWTTRRPTCRWKNNIKPDIKEKDAVL